MSPDTAPDPISGSLPYVAFSCRYAPLPLIHAAGLVPYRLLPITDAPDEAGTVLHENVCPHVKKIVDRLVSNDLPELAGAVMVTSCDAMTRLADAWAQLRPDDPAATIDLPATTDPASVSYLAAELGLLKAQLETWATTWFSRHDPAGPKAGVITAESISASARLYSRLAGELERLREGAARGQLEGGWSRLQSLRNRSVTEPPELVVDELAAVELGSRDEPGPASVPALLFGNVLPEPDALDLFAACGVELLDDDLCTGSRQIEPIELLPTGEVLEQLAFAMLHGSACARTVTVGDPDSLARQLVRKTRSAGARGVITYIMKFCDPYLARLPSIRNELEKEGLPMLILEGDCTLRSLGQHRTRIEAFAEMLGGGR